MFEFWLFSVNCDFVQRAVAAGVDGIIVDWENRGKRERQRGADTQINHDSLEDLVRVRRATDARIIVRISQFGLGTAGEIQQALDGGADEILLPMVESVDEVQRTLSLARGKIAVGILIETLGAVAIADRLGQLPLARVFVGLNDLSIQRGTRNIFVPLIDGTLESVRRHIPMRLGFGGLTLPDRGFPVPCRLLMGELARLGASFSFLRRSFIRDVAGQDMGAAVARMRVAVAAAQIRDTEQIAADRHSLVGAIQAMDAEAADVFAGASQGVGEG